MALRNMLFWPLVLSRQSHFSYLVEPFTTEEFRIHILQPIIILKEMKSPNICILLSATLKDSL